MLFNNMMLFNILREKCLFDEEKNENIKIVIINEYYCRLKFNAFFSKFGLHSLNFYMREKWGFSFHWEM